MKVLRGDRNQCQVCKHYVNSTGAFEKHRTGAHGVDRRCRTAEEMLEKGMSLKADGFWITSQMSSDLIEKREERKHENQPA